MNLICDRWIPVLDRNGEIRDVGLESLFRASPELVDLALRPTHRVGVMRLLLAVVYAARGTPANAPAWAECRGEIAEACMTYLDQRRGLFELYGDRPFLQVPGLQETRNATLDKFDFSLSSGNNDTLFDHGGCPEGRRHDPAWCALNLLTYQCFSPGGLVGETIWGGKKTGRKSEHAPAVECSPLHAIIRGKTLLDTIHLNLVPGDLLPAPVGMPVWDITIPRPTGEASHAFASSVLGRLVPLSRAVLLVEGERSATLGNGIAYPKIADGGRELSTTVVVRNQHGKQIHTYLRIDLAKHPWRELPSILALKEADRGGSLALQNLYRQKLDDTVDLWVGGLVANQGKLVDEAEWNFSIPLSELDERTLQIYQHGVTIANNGDKALRRAVRTYASKLEADGQGFRQASVMLYWSALDQQYGALIEVAESRESLEAWRNILRKAMNRAYRDACPHQTPRQIQAFVAGRRGLSLPAG